MKQAIALASGGLDSTTAIALAQTQGFDIHALTIDYGQRHRCEIDAAKKVIKALGIKQHVILSIDLRAFGGSALTADIDVPKNRDAGKVDDTIPVTYVPARNTIFLSLALGWCEALGAQDIIIGANAVDYSGYPDCRPAFLEAFERMAKVATKAGVEGQADYKIYAPLLRMTKAQIIRAGTDAGVDYSLTHSCYDPSPEGLACGGCDSCIIRKRGFQEAGIPDPTQY
jgi:7-cyano-7-deazaguanine synthase